MASKNEPQSYGSQSEWVRGDTGGEVQDQKSEPPAEHSDFYQSRRGPDRGGLPSGVEKDAGTTGATEVDEQPTRKITSLPTGAITSSYFKKRDYE